MSCFVRQASADLDTVADVSLVFSPDRCRSTSSCLVLAFLFVFSLGTLSCCFCLLLFPSRAASFTSEQARKGVG